MKHNTKFKQPEKMMTHYERDPISISGGEPVRSVNNIPWNEITIQTLLLQLERKIEPKMIEFEEMQLAILIGMVKRQSPNDISVSLMTMASLINELLPVLYIVKMNYPKQADFFDALIDLYNKEKQ